MDTMPDMEIHRNNLTAIKNLLSKIKEADVWCAWGNTIEKRKYLYDLLLGNTAKGIDSIISLFNTNYHFKAYGSTVKGCPKHPLVISNDDKLKDLAEIGLMELNNKILTYAPKNQIKGYVLWTGGITDVMFRGRYKSKQYTTEDNSAAIDGVTIWDAQVSKRFFGQRLFVGGEIIYMFYTRQMNTKD